MGADEADGVAAGCDDADVRGGVQGGGDGLGAFPVDGLAGVDSDGVRLEAELVAAGVPVQGAGAVDLGEIEGVVDDVDVGDAAGLEEGGPVGGDADDGGALGEDGEEAPPQQRLDGSGVVLQGFVVVEEEDRAGPHGGGEEQEAEVVPDEGAGLVAQGPDGGGEAGQVAELAPAAGAVGAFVVRHGAPVDLVGGDLVEHPEVGPAAGAADRYEGIDDRFHGRASWVGSRWRSCSARRRA
jgi:hypothetical protein